MHAGPVGEPAKPAKSTIAPTLSKFNRLLQLAAEPVTRLHGGQGQAPLKSAKAALGEIVRLARENAGPEATAQLRTAIRTMRDVEKKSDKQIVTALLSDAQSPLALADRLHIAERVHKGHVKHEQSDVDVEADELIDFRPRSREAVSPASPVSHRESGDTQRDSDPEASPPPSRKPLATRLRSVASAARLRKADKPAPLHTPDEVIAEILQQVGKHGGDTNAILAEIRKKTAEGMDQKKIAGALLIRDDLLPAKVRLAIAERIARDPTQPGDEPRSRFSFS